ncbi:PepSY-associated TM helix domain-containing protein [Stakelama saccharophila]|uniref:PepSY-associated TM helix domain-containing protein n=1 Tax=Stakelama saccharophila TaxID=3075605 RepID=A0ABZ0BAZ7_9SPHN|nr:PepSY-associated TM helix domain-containing protein [Stakelama sp. W311]WNO54590.1 PepSY-associated TM helix domain-containing protein [Stakelama sp. W311]
MKVRDGVRQTMAWLHGWTGLLLGWVLYLMAFAGTMSMFRGAITRWTHPESTATAAPVSAVAAAIRWLKSHAGDAPAWYLTAPDARTNTVHATWFDGSGFIVRALDPVTGAPALRQSLGGDFFYRLHFELEIPYPWGRLLAALAAAFMLLALITGIIAHRRFFRDFFTFRPGRGQRAWLDGHNAMGVLALPFHIMITFTGLVTFTSLVMPWGIVADYGKDTAAMYQDLLPGAVTRPASGEDAPLAPVLPMLQEAQRRFGDGHIGRVTMTNPGDAAATLTIFQSDGDRLATTPHILTFDAATGDILADVAEHRPALQSYAILYGLHMGRFAGPLLRWLYFAGGLALTAVIGSGLVLWIVKRRERAPLSLANRAIERINVGVIAGMPAAFAGFFLANRLLPLDLAGRAGWEVTCVFAGWAVAGLIVLALPSRRSWPALLAAGAVAWAAAALIDIGRIAAQGASADAATVPTDAVLLATATALAIAARYAARTPEARCRS